MAGPKFRYLPHTADIEFSAYGKDVSEAMENAALALLSVVLDVKKIRSSRKATKSIKISEEADTLENLTWFVLQDINSKRASSYISAYGFKVDSFAKAGGKYIIKGRLLYKKLAEDYTLLDVKAVTPHDLSVKLRKGRCTMTVTLDV